MARIWAFLLVFCVFSADEEKIQYKQSEISSGIETVYYCGGKTGTIIIITEDRTLYRSENSGNSWKEIPEPTKGWKLKRLTASKADNKLIGLLGKQGTNMYSEDCGKTLRSLNFDKVIEAFQFHPSFKNWALALSQGECGEDEESCAKGKVLYLTKDLGETWTMLSENVMQFSWGHDGLSSELTKLMPLERIYITKNNDPGKSGDMDVDFVKSDDFFQSSQVVVRRGQRFLFANQYILVAAADQGDKDDVQLMVASKEGVDEFHRAELPVKRLPQLSFTLADTTQGSVVIHVNHYSKRSDYGSLYISDSLGKTFSLSLHHNVRGSLGYCDFDRVKGLEGIYFANIYDKDLYLDNLPEKRGKKDTLKFQKSLISLDKGGNWKRISAPRVDSDGKSIECDDDCYLNLHSVTSTYSQIYSNENAIGLVLATGNIGKFLSYQEDELNTYMSRDGGVTWAEIRKGEYVYQMGDHGGIILIADSQKSTKKLEYSWDEGKTWSTLTLDKEFEIQDIAIEPGSTSQKFLVYGRTQDKGVTVSVDFSAFHNPACRNPESPNTSQSDYEIWTPNTGVAGTCLMGRNIEYVRRKQDVQCFNGEEFERLRFVKNCECTEEDFECDYGYYREGNGECKPTGQVGLEPECVEGVKVFKTGYRRVAGNSCEGGVSVVYDWRSENCGFDYSLLIGTGAAFMFALAGIWAIRKYANKLENCKFWIKDSFDRSGFISDFSNAPEGFEEEMGVKKLSKIEDDDYTKLK